MEGYPIAVLIELSTPGVHAFLSSEDNIKIGMVAWC